MSTYIEINLLQSQSLITPEGLEKQGVKYMDFSIYDLFDDIPLIDVVDIGASPIDGQPPYQTLMDQGRANIIGFEPNPAQYNRLVPLQKQKCRFLPYAVGDGKSHTLNICLAPGMTSLLEPDMAVLNHFQGFGQWAEIIDRQTLETRRLDDIEEITGMDFLKLDTQGSEFSIIQNGLQRIKQALVIHLEVQFVPFYKKQPLFGDLDQALVQAGFYLHRFTPLISRLFKPLVVENDIYAGLSQVLWTDAVYVRKFTEFPQLASPQLLKIAAITHELYKSYDLCSFALGQADSKDGTKRQSLYLNRLTGRTSL